MSISWSGRWVPSLKSIWFRNLCFSLVWKMKLKWICLFLFLAGALPVLAAAVELCWPTEFLHGLLLPANVEGYSAVSSANLQHGRRAQFVRLDAQPDLEVCTLLLFFYVYVRLHHSYVTPSFFYYGHFNTGQTRTFTTARIPTCIPLRLQIN